MDANAANLVAQAWELYHGTEPTPPVVTQRSTRERALVFSRTHIGEKEAPAGSNNTKYGAWYGVNYQPWCAIFCTYCFEVGAGGSPSFTRGSNYAYVPYVVQDARNSRNGLSVTGAPIPGDLVCYDWNSDGTYDHIGIFEAWDNSGRSEFTAIEGNTGSRESTRTVVR